jgi:hypothetical protein
MLRLATRLTERVGGGWDRLHVGETRFGKERTVMVPRFGCGLMSAGLPRFLRSCRGNQCLYSNELASSLASKRRTRDQRGEYTCDSVRIG